MNFKYAVPYLTVKDTQAAIKFYQKAFGFKLIKIQLNKLDVIEHVEMETDNVKIMFSTEGACSDPSLSPKTTKTVCPIGIYIYCEDMDTIYKQAMEQGAVSKSEPRLRYWGERMCEIEDLDGYQWYFTSR